MKLLCSPNGEEETVITYDQDKQQFEVDFERASAKDISYTCGPTTLRKGKLKQIVPFPLQESSALYLDIFVDHSVIEVFVNSRVCLVQRVYPIRDDSTQFRLFSEDGSVEATALHKWDMDATNPW
jgi:beta-fructofuranosidase